MEIRLTALGPLSATLPSFHPSPPHFTAQRRHNSELHDITYNFIRIATITFPVNNN